MGPLVLGAIALAVVLVVVGFVVLGKRKSRPVADAETYRKLMGGTGNAPATDTPEIAELRQNLRVKLLHQEDKIDAAIQFERERNPSAPLPALMRAAIERWERDNR